jgi:AcrR family transcriptional regulator
MVIFKDGFLTNHWSRRLATPSIRRKAVGEEQKEARRQAILDGAWELFQQTPYEKLTMASIAEALDLAKGTAFTYFNTKEALFLAVLEQQLEGWFAEVDTSLAQFPVPSSIPQVAELVCGTLDARPGLARLLAILHTVLERNIDLETAVAFKQFLLAHFAQTGQALERSLAFLKPGEGAHLLLQSYALVIGFWHLADPAPVMRQALERSELRPFIVTFAREFSAALQALWYGLERLAHTAS